MPACRNHPDREAFLPCRKHNSGLCGECVENNPECLDPHLYCKFRTECVINELMKEKSREGKTVDQD